MSREIKELFFSTNNEEQKFGSIEQSRVGNGTETFANLSIETDPEIQIHHVVNTMRRHFVNCGDKCLPQNKLLKSRYLREFSDLLLDSNFEVYQVITDHFGNYIDFRLIPHQNLLPMFNHLHKQNKEFFRFIQSHPTLLKIYQECYAR